MKTALVKVDDLITKYQQECPKCEGSGRWVFNCFQAGDQSVEEIEDCPDCAARERLIREVWRLAFDAGVATLF